jgi:hypothetical protein
MKIKFLGHVFAFIISATFICAIIPGPTVSAAPPAFYCWISNGPFEGWEGESIEFIGGGYGGYTPYSYRWDWTNDGTYDTGWSSGSAWHAYYPASSPQTYTVKMQGKDGGATPQYDTDTDTVKIYKDYDLESDIDVPFIVMGNSYVTFRPQAINDQDYVAPDIVNGEYTWEGICELDKYNFRTEEWEYIDHWTHYPYNEDDGDIDVGDDYQWETFPSWHAGEDGKYRVFHYIDTDHDTNMNDNYREDIFWVIFS